MTVLSGAIVGSPYPERDEPREGKLDRMLATVRYFGGRFRTGNKRLKNIIEATGERAKGLDVLSEQELRARAAALRPRLRREGFSSVALAGEGCS